MIGKPLHPTSEYNCGDDDDYGNHTMICQAQWWTVHSTCIHTGTHAYMSGCNDENTSRDIAIVQVPS